MYSTAYNLWTFTWFVHFLPFRLAKFIPRDCLNSTQIYILFSLLIKSSETEFETRLNYGWLHLKLDSTFQDLSRRSIKTGFWLKFIWVFLKNIIHFFQWLNLCFVVWIKIICRKFYINLFDKKLLWNIYFLFLLVSLQNKMYKQTTGDISSKTNTWPMFKTECYKWAQIERLDF